MAKETGYVLGKSGTEAPQVFAGFPGVWEAGVPIAVSDLGMSESEADKLIKDLGLPLKKATATPSTEEEGS